VFCFETLPGRQAIQRWNIKWLLKLTADKMWVNRQQNFYSFSTKILQPFWANVQTRNTKSKTHIKITLCITVCYYNLVHSSATEKFRSLHKCLCPTFDMRHKLQFHLLYRKITSFLIEFMFFGTQYPWRNGKTNGRAVPIFDLFLYEKYKVVSSRYQYAAFFDECRFRTTITNICASLKHFVRLATSIRR